MSYRDTFIRIAPDSPVRSSIVPSARGGKKPIHVLQYELLSAHPYQYSHDDLVFEVYIRQQGIPSEELSARGQDIRAELLSKEHPCLRASALTKKYGWGAHYNSEGKIALYGAESKEYQEFVEMMAGTRNLLTAMRSKRA